MDDLLEDDIKNSILHLQSIFRPEKLGESLIIYEKTINFKTIADCLIFTQKRGIIGIEIKTQHDTLKRLPSQLRDYVRACSYVYVYCHDSKIEGVKHVLNKLNYPFVGIISYTEFDGKVIPGLIQKAHLSNYVSSYIATSLLWKKELRAIIKETKHETGNDDNYLTKSELAEQFESFYPGFKGNRLIAQFYAYDLMDRNKPLQKYHFGMNYNHDRTEDQANFQATRHWRKLAHYNRRFHK